MTTYPIKSIVSIEGGDLRCAIEPPQHFVKCDEEMRFMIIGLVMSWFEETPLLQKAKHEALSNKVLAGLSFRSEMEFILKYEEPEGWSYQSHIPEDILALERPVQMLIILATHKKLLEFELLCNPSVVKH